MDARNSTFTYKGKPVKIKQVSECLGRVFERLSGPLQAVQKIVGSNIIIQ
jgi:TolB-like protein